jgi:hypothetical protein
MLTTIDRSATAALTGLQSGNLTHEEAAKRFFAEAAHALQFLANHAGERHEYGRRD